MLAPRIRPLPWFAVVSFLVLLWFYHRDADRIYPQWVLSMEARPEKPPANRTLGFGAVVVVSKEGSSRRHALLQAANVTGIDLTIPPQPAWSDGDVLTFRNGQEDGAQKGSILAWLGHHNALRWFLNSSLETALILEDDVDWDVRLRSVQIPLAASTARSLLPPAKAFSPFAPFRRADENHTQYWGDPFSWDLLYLGHCGDYFNSVSFEGLTPPEGGYDFDHLPHTLYHDPTLPAKGDLHPFTKELFDKLGMQDHQRAFHRSQFPLCSFGYAITRPAAERLLTDLAPAQQQPQGPRAFDVALLHACLKGLETPSPTPKENPKPHPDPQLRKKYASPGLRCWTLNSELFHHMPGESEIARIGEETGHVSGTPPVDWAGKQQLSERLETTNIGCGFWSGAFAFDHDDAARLHLLQEQVGRRGKCLKEGRDSL